jgi:ATP-dependent helicase/nuclease subunit A
VAAPSTERLTKLQAAALDLSANRLISASAGTGKTHVLTALYLSLLSGRLTPGGKFLEDRSEWLRRFASGQIQPLRASTVVAVTFTKKAAAELLERARIDLEREIASPDLPPQLAAHLKACREELPGAPVCTIDAFCARLLRDAGARSSAPAGFTILDETDAPVMLENAFFEAATRLLEAPGHTNFKTLAREWSVLGHGGLRDSGMNLFRSLRSQGRQPADLRLYVPPVMSEEQIRIALQEFVKAVVDLKVKYAKALELKEICARMPLTNLENLHRAALAFSAAVPDKAAWAKPLPNPFPEIITALHAPYAAELAGYVELAAENYTRAKQREGCVDFDDLIFYARELLTGDNPVAIPYRFVLIDEYQDTNPLQDEVLQAVAVQAQSKQQNPESKVSLAVVGDVKQSIYGFRGADVSLIGSAQRNMATSPLSESFRSRRTLIEFFNEFFTDLWAVPPAGALIDGMRKTFIYEPSHRLQPSTEIQRHWIFDTVESAGITGEILSAGNLDVGNVDENRWHQALAIARRIRTLIQPREGGQLFRPRVWEKKTGAFSERIRYGDIAILARTIKHLRVPLQSALARMGIPFRMLGGLSFYSRQEVLDVINLLASVADPSDNLALAGFLRSPFAGLSDAQLWQLVMDSDGRPTRNVYEQLLLSTAPNAAAAAKLLSSLYAGLGRLTAAEIIDRACTATGFLSVLAMQPQGEVAVAAVRRLIEVSRAFESRKAPHLSDFVRELREKADVESDEPGRKGGPDLNDNLPDGSDAVQIGTIHSAKGLEFPVVVLADVGAQHNNSSVRAVFYPGQGRGLGLRLGIEHEGLAAVSDSIHDNVCEREKWAAGEERKRLLYVALTRAREYVIIAGEAKAKSGVTWRSLFDDYAKKFNGRLAEVPYRHPDLLAAMPDTPLAMLDYRTFDPASDKPVSLLQAAADSVPAPAAPLVSGKLLQRNVTVSVSQLSRWLSCPRREELDRWLVDDKATTRPAPDGDEIAEADDNDDDPDSRALGTAAHTTLESVFSDPESVLDAEWSAALAQAGLDAAHESCRQTRESLAKVLESPWGRKVRALPPTQRLTEKPFRLKVIADPATGSTITLSGKLDLLAAVSGSAWQVVDYKLAEKPRGSAGDPTVQRYAWQTLLYAWVAATILRQSAAATQTIEPMLMFLRDSNGPRPLTLNELGFVDSRSGFDCTPAMIAAWRSLSSRGEFQRPAVRWVPGTEKPGERTRDLCSGEHCPHLQLCFK